MNYPEVYNLSNKFGPPRIDLREAEIIDSYGEDSFAIHLIKHTRPEDVRRADLDFYPHVWPFVHMLDLLFYLHPVAAHYEMDPQLPCIDSYLYTLDHVFDRLSGHIVVTDQAALIKGITWMWEAGGPVNADWVACQTLQKAIGVNFTWEDRLREWRKQRWIK